jgi:hypothetical protein
MKLSITATNMQWRESCFFYERTHMCYCGYGRMVGLPCARQRCRHLIGIVDGVGGSSTLMGRRGASMWLPSRVQVGYRWQCSGRAATTLHGSRVIPEVTLGARTTSCRQHTLGIMVQAIRARDVAVA